MLLTLIYALIYGSITFVNHLLFRTNAVDLGIKNQTVWYFSQGRMATSSILPELQGELSVFANHFEPILALISPLWWIFGSWTLLIVQWAAVLWGGWGCFSVAKKWLSNPWHAVGIALTYYTGWGFFSAFGFDFHTNVLAAAIIPWFTYYLTQARILPALIMGFLWLSCKETQGLLMFFVATGLAWEFRKEKKQLKMALGFALMAITWFVLVLKLVMPHFAEGRLDYFHFQYSALGENGPDLVKNVLKNPLRAISLLVMDPYASEPQLAHYKMQFIWSLLISGAFLLFLRPVWIWMMLPVLLQKLWSDQPSHWGPFFHYSAELMPVMSLGFAMVLARNFSRKTVFWLLMFLSIAGLEIAKKSLVWYRLYPWARSAVDYTYPTHYQRSFSTSRLKEIIRQIPENVSVAATDFVVPHLADREEIFVYPHQPMAEYVLFVEDDRDLPAEERAAIDAARPGEDYEQLINEPPFYLWKRK